MSMLQARRFVPAVVGTLVLASSTIASADPSSRPFSVTISGNANPVPDPSNPCILLNTETATGTALHLGASEWASTEVVDFCSIPPAAEIAGEFVVSAANGDRIFGRYQTVGQVDFAASLITVIGRYQITGGSGRFEGATGEGEITATGSLAPPFGFTGGLFGRISY